MPSSDWGEAQDDGAGSDATRPVFGRNADSDCVYCSRVTGKKTAEVLYASQEWDYYYCYRCRGWFKRRFRSPKVFLPVNDRTEIKHLTWFYVGRMQSDYERKKILERMGSVWRSVERRLTQV